MMSLLEWHIVFFLAVHVLQSFCCCRYCCLGSYHFSLLLPPSLLLLPLLPLLLPMSSAKEPASAPFLARAAAMSLNSTVALPLAAALGVEGLGAHPVMKMTCKWGIGGAYV
jgi:hypothetical protein